MPPRGDIGLLNLVVFLVLLGLLVFWLIPGGGDSARSVSGEAGTVWERGQPLP